MECFMVDVIENLQINYDLLLKQGYGVIDVRYRDYDVTAEPFKMVVVRVDRDRESFYQDMLKHYLGKEIGDNNIYNLWTEVLKHKLKMSSMMKRDVSIKVAALDYLESDE